MPSGGRRLWLKAQKEIKKKGGERSLDISNIRLACYTGPWGSEGLVRAIADIAALGFEGLECPATVVQQYEDRLHVFEEILESSRLKLAGLLQPLNLLDAAHADEQVERAANTARFAAAAGASSVTICHSIPFQDTANDEMWMTFGAIVEEIGNRCREFGIQMCFMPRARHMVATERDIERLLAMTRKEMVALAVDTAEAALAGAAPQRLIRNYRDRLRAVRYREASGSKRRPRVTSDVRGSAPAFGRGAVNFEVVSKALLEEDYEGWVILDVTGESQPPAHAAAAGYRYLVRKSGLFPKI